MMSEQNVSETSPPPPPPPPCPPPPLLLPPLLGTAAESPNGTLSSHGKVNKAEVENCFKRFLSCKGMKSIYYTYNTCLTPQLQEGPQCGLVALSIATSATDNFITVKEIFEKAVAQGFTKQGEIFDAKFLKYLAEEFGFKANILEGGLKKHLRCIIKWLLNKSLILIPYDADFNHGPCCKKGYKAHWAVICGFVIFQSAEDEKPQDNNFVLLKTLQSSNLCDCVENMKWNNNISLKFSYYQGNILIGKNSKDFDSHSNYEEGEVYLMGMQGKSRHIGLWSFDEMADSNDNLIYFSTNRDSECFVLPEEGLPGGLKGKIIILECPTEQ